MSIKSDKWIRRQCEIGPQREGPGPMIEPFEPHQVRTRHVVREARPDLPGLLRPVEYDEKIISYGTSSYGYDVRCADEFKVFTNVNSTVVDPKNFDEKSFIDFKGDVCIIPPNSFALARTVEYFRIPRNVLVVCLGKSTYARCFSGSTKVALVGGKTITFKKMVKQAARGKRFFGYGLSKTGGIQVVELVAPRKIASGEKLLRVTLDNGEYVDCTPDHKFLTRSGRYVEAQDLSVNDSLMPLYRYECRDREVVYDPIRECLEATYRLSDAWNVRHGRYEAGENEHRHHIDHNKRNDHPFNIERLQASEHVKHHNDEYYGLDFDAVLHGKKIRKALKTLALDPEWLANYKACQSRRASRFWSEEKYSDAREEISRKRKARWKDPEFRRIQSESLKKFWSSDEGRKVLEKRKMPKRIKLSRTRVELAIKSTGSLRRAADFLGVSTRPLRERFPNLIARMKRQGFLRTGDPVTLSLKEAEKALRSCGSINAASKLLGISSPALNKHASKLISDLRKEGVLPTSNHKVRSIKKLGGFHDVYCLTSPETGNFALEAGVFVKNCGIIVNVTPIEPEWEGYITLEFSNTTPLPAKIYANEGVAQLLFLEADEVCETSYADRGGKYQGQHGVTLPRT